MSRHGLVTTPRGRKLAAYSIAASLQCATGALLLAVIPACGPKGNRVIIQSLRDPALPEQFTESFDDAWYGTDGRGRWDVVLHALHPAAADPSQTIQQIVHLRLFWRPVPGTTFAESSQTDAVITYALISPATAIGYDGAGFVYLELDRRGGLRGRVESSTLKPHRRVGEPIDLFGDSRLTGEFLARRDSGRVSQLLSEMARRLGPRPDAPVSESKDPM